MARRWVSSMLCCETARRRSGRRGVRLGRCGANVLVSRVWSHWQAISFSPRSIDHLIASFAHSPWLQELLQRRAPPRVVPRPLANNGDPKTHLGKAGLLGRALVSSIDLHVRMPLSKGRNHIAKKPVGHRGRVPIQPGVSPRATRRMVLTASSISSSGGAHYVGEADADGVLLRSACSARVWSSGPRRPSPLATRHGSYRGISCRRKPAAALCGLPAMRFTPVTSPPRFIGSSPAHGTSAWSLISGPVGTRAAIFALGPLRIFSKTGNQTRAG